MLCYIIIIPLVLCSALQRNIVLFLLILFYDYIIKYLVMLIFI
jgi:hypothetical protein